MKDSTPIIMLVVFLVLVLAGILIYVFVFAPTATTTAKAGTLGGGTGTQPGADAGMVSDDELKAQAKQFRDSFLANYWNDDVNDGTNTGRCNSIHSVNSLSDNDLRRFETIYRTLYNTTPKVDMDNANVWCGAWDYFGAGVAQNLFDRLK